MASRFRRYVLLNTAIIVGSFLGFGVLFYFFSGSLKAKADDITADRALIMRRSLDIASLSDLKANATAAATIQNKIDTLLPSQDELIGFPQSLNVIARNHSLSLTFAFEGAPVDSVPPAPGFVSFVAIVEGSPENILGFTNELERKTTKFIINLQDFSFAPSGNIYRANLKGKVFFQAK